MKWRGPFGVVFKIEALIWGSFWRALKWKPFSWRAGSHSRCQSKNIEMKYKTRIELVHDIYGTCFQYNVKRLRINHLTPPLVVTMPYTCWFLWQVDDIEDFKWCLRFQVRVAFWRVVLSEVYFEGQIAFEGHWRLQSWTLGPGRTLRNCHMKTTCVY